MNNRFKRRPLPPLAPTRDTRAMSSSADAVAPTPSSGSDVSPGASSGEASMAVAAPTGGRGLLLAAVSLSFACVAFDNTKLIVAVPTLVRELGAHPAARLAVGWIVEANLVVYASLLLLGGALCERLGARRALLVGLSLFAVASAAAATSRSTWGLCAARALSGLGTALMTPASLAAVRFAFEGAARARAIAIWTASFAAAAALGPVLG